VDKGLKAGVPDKTPALIVLRLSDGRPAT
jgi:hypothetical protein